MTENRNDDLLPRLEEILANFGNKSNISEKEQAVLNEVKALRESVAEMSQSQSDLNVRLEILAERFAGFLTRYEELKEDVESLQAKEVENAGSSKRFTDQALLLAIGGIVTYAVQALLNK